MSTIKPLEIPELYSSKPLQAPWIGEDMRVWSELFLNPCRPREALLADYDEPVMELVKSVDQAFWLLDEDATRCNHTQVLCERLVTVCDIALRYYAEGRRNQYKLNILYKRAAITAWCLDEENISDYHMRRACRQVGTPESALLGIACDLRFHADVQDDRRIVGTRMAISYLERAIKKSRGPGKGLVALAERAQAGRIDDVEIEDGINAATEPGPTDGVVVVPSLDHLPERVGEWGGKSGPRAEFGKLARRRLPLVKPPADIAAAREILREEFPHALDAIDVVLGDAARSPEGAWIRPTLFLDDPGSGKTRLARRIGEVLGLATTVYSCGGASDGTLGGTSRQWSTGRASVPLQAIRRSKTANPLIVLDEIDKGGTGTANGNLLDAAVGLLERETARVYHDPYLETDVDLSRVSWLATANEKHRIPAPILDRLRILHLPRPVAAHGPQIARSIIRDLRAERGLDAAWIPDLDGEEEAMVVRAWVEQGRSIRTLRRLVEVLVDGRERLAARH